MSDTSLIGSAILGETKVLIYRDKYRMPPFNLAIAANVDEEYQEPFATISVNLGNAIEENEFVVSHNVQHFDADLLATGFFEDTGKRVDYGFVRQRPIWRLKV